MIHEEIILTVNTASIIILLIMALLLCSASRFKGESCYVSLTILFTTIPDYIYNVCDFFDWDYVALLMAPIAYSANLTVMPFMLLLAHRSFNPYYRFRYAYFLHFLPAMVFAMLVGMELSGMSAEEQENFSVERVASFQSMLTGVNFSMISAQLLVYSYFIFSYLRRVRSVITNTQSQADLLGKVWIPRFITFISVLIIVAMLGSQFYPLGGFRLFYIINALAMSYLLYSELQLVFAVRKNSIPSQVEITEMETDAHSFLAETAVCKSSADDSAEYTLALKQYAVRVEEYLHDTEAYTNPNLTLRDVAKATGISSNNLSRAINSVLGKSFFNLVNEMRVEKSKSMLLQKKENGLTLETIAEKCGFNSRVTFNNAFKRVTGSTTTEWCRQSHA